MITLHLNLETAQVAVVALRYMCRAKGIGPQFEIARKAANDLERAIEASSSAGIGEKAVDMNGIETPSSLLEK